MKYHLMCKVYTDVGGIKLVDYLHVQADNSWYNYYLITSCSSCYGLNLVLKCLLLWVNNVTSFSIKVLGCSSVNNRYHFITKLTLYKWHTSWETLILSYANIKSAYQSAHHMQSDQCLYYSFSDKYELDSFS